MTHEELIAKAREHMKPFERIDSDMPPLDAYSAVRVRDTVIVYFSRDGADDCFEICLDRSTGEFVGASYMPKTVCVSGQRFHKRRVRLAF